MAPDSAFRCEVEHQKEKDEHENRVTIVRCHGRLVSDTADGIKDTVKPLIPQGGRIIIDLADLTHLDSSGLGALVGLKASAIRQGYCSLELSNATPNVLELLRVTRLTQLFSS